MNLLSRVENRRFMADWADFDAEPLVESNGSETLCNTRCDSPKSAHFVHLDHTPSLRGQQASIITATLPPFFVFSQETDPQDADPLALGSSNALSKTQKDIPCSRKS